LKERTRERDAARAVVSSLSRTIESLERKVAARDARIAALERDNKIIHEGGAEASAGEAGKYCRILELEKQLAALTPADPPKPAPIANALRLRGNDPRRTGP